MRILSDLTNRAAAFAALFAETFTASEGPEEGALIGGLAADLMTETRAEDLRAFAAAQEDALIGGVIFTRIVFAEDDRPAFILAPLAVAPDRQRQGVGGALIAHGLAALRDEGVAVALVYGDPNYYTRAGFAPASAEVAPPPRALAYPQGWMARSLTDAALTPLQGPSRCVAALQKPAYW